MQRPITKDHKEILQQWANSASSCYTTAQLVEFIDKLCEYKHDYETIVHAIFNAMIATMRVIDHSSQGGISGNQAGLLGQMLARKFLAHGQDSPLRFIDFSNMLYPQYAKFFDTTISPETWEWIQSKAKKYIMGYALGNDNAKPKIIEHWRTIINGDVPFGWRIELLNTYSIY